MLRAATRPAVDEEYSLRKPSVPPLNLPWSPGTRHVAYTVSWSLTAGLVLITNAISRPVRLLKGVMVLSPEVDVFPPNGRLGLRPVWVDVDPPMIIGRFGETVRARLIDLGPFALVPRVARRRESRGTAQARSTHRADAGWRKPNSASESTVNTSSPCWLCLPSASRRCRDPACSPTRACRARAVRRTASPTRTGLSQRICRGRASPSKWNRRACRARGCPSSRNTYSSRSRRVRRTATPHRLLPILERLRVVLRCELDDLFARERVRAQMPRLADFKIFVAVGHAISFVGRS